MTLYLEFRLILVQLLWSDEVCRLRLGRLLALGMVDCSRSIGHTGAYLGPAAVQLTDRLLWKGDPIAPGPTASIRYG